jgi:hypothetical protein
MNNTKEDIRKILKLSNFIVIYKPLAKKIGLQETLFLQYLIDWQEYVEKEQQDEWFYCTERQIEDNITLSPYQQRKIVEKLKKLGILEVKKQGMPAKNYYKINFSQISNLLTTRCEETLQQDVKKLNNKMLRNLTTDGSKNYIENEEDLKMLDEKEKKERTKEKKENNENNNDIYINNMSESSVANATGREQECSRQKSENRKKDIYHPYVQEILRYFGDVFKFIFKSEYNCKFQYEYNMIKNLLKQYEKERKEIEKAKNFILNLIDIYFTEIKNRIEKGYTPNPSVSKFYKEIPRLVVLHNYVKCEFVRWDLKMNKQNNAVINSNGQNSKN